MSKHYLFEKAKPFGGWESKLKQLTATAVSDDCLPSASNSKKTQK
jgi:hypothetical protein